MVARFDAEATALDLPAAAAAAGLTPYQAVTVASIVQKEAISPGDSAAATAHNAGPVARVVYNRLARGTPLQMDSTVLYAEGRDGGPVTSADESLATPYNTYLHTGLTPTPICLPSPLALRAALHPPAGDWLYFELTQKDGTETFSDTFAGQVGGRASWRRAGDSRDAGERGSGGRRPGPRPLPLSSVSSATRWPTHCRLCCTTPRSMRSGSTGCRWPSRLPPDGWPTRWPGSGPSVWSGSR